MTWFNHIKAVLGAMILSSIIGFVFLTPKAILGYTVVAVGVATIGIVINLHEGEDV